MLYYNQDIINCRDTVCGTVVGGSKDGLFIRLDNFDMAFAAFGYLPSGARVLCTVFKKATRNNYAHVGVDTVLSDYEIVA